MYECWNCENEEEWNNKFEHRMDPRCNELQFVQNGRCGEKDRRRCEGYSAKRGQKCTDQKQHERERSDLTRERLRLT